MTKNKCHVAYDDNALFAKSQLYISRGYKASQGNDLEEYQLWAALALELLGKSTLAWVSPTLVADPQCVESLFAACGRPGPCPCQDPRSLPADQRGNPTGVGHCSRNKAVVELEARNTQNWC